MRLKDLTEEQTKEAMDNVSNEGRVAVVHYYTAIASAFFWCQSNEGFHYWNDIVTNFNNK